MHLNAYLLPPSADAPLLPYVVFLLPRESELLQLHDGDSLQPAWRYVLNEERLVFHQIVRSKRTSQALTLLLFNLLPGNLKCLLVGCLAFP